MRRSVDVSIDDADLQSDRLQAETQIGSHGRFSDAAFAEAGNDVLDAGDALHPRAALGCGGCGLTRPCAIARCAFGPSCLNTRMLGSRG